MVLLPFKPMEVCLWQEYQGRNPDSWGWRGFWGGFLTTYSCMKVPQSRDGLIFRWLIRSIREERNITLRCEREGVFLHFRRYLNQLFGVIHTYQLVHASPVPAMIVLCFVPCLYIQTIQTPIIKHTGMRQHYYNFVWLRRRS